MTENQAIKILEEKKSWESDDRIIDAFIMAIEALKEIQQYKAIGTVEEFANAKRRVHIADMAVEHIEREKQKIRTKAIDEFKNKICMHFADWQYSEDDKWIKDIIELAGESVEEIAEQMKAGGENGKINFK